MVSRKKEKEIGNFINCNLLNRYLWDYINKIVLYITILPNETYNNFRWSVNKI